MRKLLTVEDFMREALGIWDSNAGQSVITSSVWESLQTVSPPADGLRTFGVKFSPDGSSVALGVCLRAEGRGPACGVDRVASMKDGRRWLVDWLVERKSGWSEVVVDGKSDAGAFVNDLREAGLPAKALHLVKLDEAVKAHSMFLEAVKTGLTHFGQPSVEPDGGGCGEAADREHGWVGLAVFGA
jgi:hypothetical protein